MQIAYLGFDAREEMPEGFLLWMGVRGLRSRVICTLDIKFMQHL